MLCKSSKCDEAVLAEGSECDCCRGFSPKQDGERVDGVVTGWGGRKSSNRSGTVMDMHVNWMIKVFLIVEAKKGGDNVDKGVVLRRHLMAQKKKKDPSGVMARIEARHAAAAGDERAALAIFITVYGSEKACTSGAGGGGGGCAVGGVGGVGGGGGMGSVGGEDSEGGLVAAVAAATVAAVAAATVAAEDAAAEEVAQRLRRSQRPLRLLRLLRSPQTAVSNTPPAKRQWVGSR